MAMPRSPPMQAVYIPRAANGRRSSRSSPQRPRQRNWIDSTRARAPRMSRLLAFVLADDPAFGFWKIVYAVLLLTACGGVYFAYTSYAAAHAGLPFVTVNVADYRTFMQPQHEHEAYPLRKRALKVLRSCAVVLDLFSARGALPTSAPAPRDTNPIGQNRLARSRRHAQTLGSYADAAFVFIGLPFRQLWRLATYLSSFSQHSLPVFESAAVAYRPQTSEDERMAAAMAVALRALLLVPADLLRQAVRYMAAFLDRDTTVLPTNTPSLRQPPLTTWPRHDTLRYENHATCAPAKFPTGPALAHHPTNQAPQRVLLTTEVKNRAPKAAAFNPYTPAVCAGL
ncbi:uncharacterized protein V1510DRAFT_217047 [Dipodascopsis tothii]|uniref:uncharacterized protein n=1 Tax=Dipodascopsis tothii TaxID=44089 RepID=UPI0034CF6682